MAPKRNTSVRSGVFDGINILLMVLFCCTTVYPFWHLVVLSFSSPQASLTRLYLFPQQPSVENFARVLERSLVLTSFGNTVARTALGVTLSLVAIVFCEYPLSKRRFPNRRFWSFFIALTMFIQGGLIPDYILVRSLRIMNTIWALVLPRLVDTFLMIVARNYFMTIPDSLEESARMDGANDIAILFRIVVPVAMPIIATVTLWLAVYHWNEWFRALIYIQDDSRQVLQVIMRRIVLEGTMLPDQGTMMDMEHRNAVNPESVKAAVIIITTAPIVAVYPFLQKYFVKGMLVGSLKG